MPGVSGRHSLYLEQAIEYLTKLLPYGDGVAFDAIQTLRAVVLGEQTTNSDLMQLLCDIKERVDVEGGFDSNDTSTYEKLAEVVTQQH